MVTVRTLCRQALIMLNFLLIIEQLVVYAQGLGLPYGIEDRLAGVGNGYTDDERIGKLVGRGPFRAL